VSRDVPTPNRSFHCAPVSIQHRVFSHFRTLLEGERGGSLFRLRGGSVSEERVSIVIPHSVTVLDLPTLSLYWPDLLGWVAVMFEATSRLQRIDESCFAGRLLRSICIPSSIEVLPNSCFSGAAIESLVFATGSHLARIETLCFFDCLLRSVFIPKNVSEIHESAFVRCSIEEVIVGRENGHCATCGSLPVDIVHSIVVSFFGGIKKVFVWKEVKILGSFCFYDTSIDELEFEEGSQLMRIEKSCFLWAYIKRICIPRSVEILCQWSFSGGVQNDEDVIYSTTDALEFEDDSRLKQIESSCFRCCSLKSICIPQLIGFLGKFCFECCEIDSFTFEAPSILTRIEKSCFIGVP
jgi:hypothetical protein